MKINVNEDVARNSDSSGWRQSQAVSNLKNWRIGKNVVRKIDTSAFNVGRVYFAQILEKLESEN